MTATGAIIQGPLAAAALVNAVALPSAQAAYTLMTQILGDNQAPLVLAALPLSLAAVGEGLATFEASLLAGQVLQIDR